MKPVGVGAVLVGFLLIWLLPFLIHLRFPHFLPSLPYGWQCLMSVLLLITTAGVYWKRSASVRRTWLSHSRSPSSVQQREYRQAVNLLWSELWHQLRRLHRRRVYSLPWFILLGSAHSGKSSWLTNAGFRRIKQVTEQPDVGVCFWLSSTAVVVELSKAYYTTDRGELVDATWRYLIRRLKRKRPRQPVTGVIAILPGDQLVLSQPVRLQEQAVQFKAVVTELNRACQLNLPLWIVISKADRLNGFTEFFRNCKQQYQMTPWGVSVPEDGSEQGFTHAIEASHRQLMALLPGLLQREKDQNARLAVVRFVLQFSMLGERLRYVFNELHRTQQAGIDVNLKGVWLSSLHQRGTSINLLATELAKIHGSQAVVESPQTQDSQSYFDHRFFEQVILNQSGNVGENTTARRVWLLGNLASYGALTILLLSGLAVCWKHIEYNNTLLRSQQSTVHQYTTAIEELNEKSHLFDAIEPLFRLRTLHERYDKTRQWYSHLGLFDREQADRVRSAYQRQLEIRLLKPLAGHFHDQLARAELEHQSSLYEHLQRYLMLFHPALNRHHNDQLLEQLPDVQQLDADQLQHALLLIADLRQLKAIDTHPDEALVNRARLALSSLPVPDLVYENLRALPQFQGSISMNVLFGNDFDTFFTLKDDSRQQAFPRLFTVDQYQTLNLSPESPLLVQEMSNLNQIRKGEPGITPVEMVQLSRAVRARYFRDYITQWQMLMSRIELRSAATLPDLNNQLLALFYTSEQYPGEKPFLFHMMGVVARQTRLSPGGDQSATKVRQQPSPKLAAAVSKTEKPIGDPAQPISNPESVNQAFAAYVSYEQQQEAELKPILGAIEKSLQTLDASNDHNRVMYDWASKEFQGNSEWLSGLWALAASDSTAASVWYHQIANEFWHFILAGASSYVQHSYRQSVYAVYREKLAQQFPLSIQAASDSRQDEFVQFFKPNGQFDDFLNQVLKPFVTHSSGRWSLKTHRADALNISQSFLSQVDNIKALQSSLFHHSDQLDVHFKLRCLDLTPKATELSIRDNSGYFQYRHGPRLWQDWVWPAGDANQLSVSMMNNQWTLSQQQYPGTWGWLRLLFRCQQWHKGNRVELRCSQGGFPFKLEFDIDSPDNPFNPKLYDKIQLPSQINR